MIQVARTWLAVTGGLAAGAIGVTAFAGATASAAPLQPLPPPTPGVTAPAPAPQNATGLPGSTNRFAPAAPGANPANPASPPLPSVVPAPGAATPMPATVTSPVTGTIRDYLQSKGVKLEAQKPQGFNALDITLPVPTRWTQVPDPNVPDAFAVIADRLGSSLYTSNAQVIVYKLIGDFDPREAINHGFGDSQQLSAWQTTNASQGDFMGFPSSIIEGTYRQNDMALNTSRRHVIATSGKDKYLVSLAVTTALSQAVADGPATDAIINGFRVTAPAAPAPAAPAAPGQAPAPLPVAAPPEASVAAPPRAPVAAPPPAPTQVSAAAPIAVPAQAPAPGTTTLPAPAGLPATAPAPGQSLTPQPTPNLLALLPGLPPLPNLHLNLLGTQPR
jgi:Probable lipoprotein LpqN